MSQYHPFDPNCPDCRPAILDPSTGRALPNDHPVMVAVNAVWEASPVEDREAYINVTAHNNRLPKDMAGCNRILDKIQKAMGP